MKDITNFKDTMPKRLDNKILKKYFQEGMLSSTLLKKLLDAFLELTPMQKRYVIETMKNIKKYHL